MGMDTNAQRDFSVGKVKWEVFLRLSGFLYRVVLLPFLQELLFLLSALKMNPFIFLLLLPV